MKDLISYSDFTKIEIRLGTIISAELNNKLRKPSFVLKIDFGNEIGIKKSSAQLKKNYNIDQLIDKQIAAVINFPKKQIGDLISEVLVLGFPDENNEPILVSPDKKLTNGGQLY
jgi:tRNA-binding protein